MMADNITGSDDFMKGTTIGVVTDVDGKLNRIA